MRDFWPTSPHSVYVYQWLLNIEQAEDLLQFVHNLVSATACFMIPCSVHCAAHVTDYRDTSYENEFFKHTLDRITSRFLYWDTNKSALSIELNAAQLQNFF